MFARRLALPAVGRVGGRRVVQEGRRQFRENPGIMERDDAGPEYDARSTRSQEVAPTAACCCPAARPMPSR